MKSRRNGAKTRQAAMSTCQKRVTASASYAAWIVSFSNGIGSLTSDGVVLIVTSMRSSPRARITRE